MIVDEMIKSMELAVKVDGGNGAKEISLCYVSDLLSNVMGQAVEGSVWVTMQGHQNIVAIASLLSLSAIVVTGGAAIEPDTIKKAQENNVTILSTEMSTFEMAGKLYAAGVKGTGD